VLWVRHASVVWECFQVHMHVLFAHIHQWGSLEIVKVSWESLNIGELRWCHTNIQIKTTKPHRCSMHFVTLYKGAPLVICKEIHLKSKRFNDIHWYFNRNSLKSIDVQWFSYNFARGYPLAWNSMISHRNLNGAHWISHTSNEFLYMLQGVSLVKCEKSLTFNELLWISWTFIWEILEGHHFQWISLHFAKGYLYTFRYV